MSSSDRGDQVDWLVKRSLWYSQNLPWSLAHSEASAAFWAVGWIEERG